jgi:drug/metabolite transporter (DMT)-like permease
MPSNFAAGLGLMVACSCFGMGIGIASNLAARKNAPAILFYTMVSLLVCLFSLAFVDWNHLSFDSSSRFWQLVLVISTTGVLNAISCVLLVKTMQYGSSGISYAIFQAAMIIPCLSAAIFWGEKLVPRQVLGLFMILIMLGLITSDKSGTVGENTFFKWIVLAVIVFTLQGVAAAFALVPSTWKNWNDSARIRPLIMFLSSFIVLLPMTRLEKEPVSIRALWLPTCISAVCSIAYIMCLWASADIMAKVGKAGIIYPIVTSGTVVLFGAYSLFVLKEKYKLQQYIGLLFGVIGIILLGQK